MDLIIKLKDLLNKFDKQIQQKASLFPSFRLLRTASKGRGADSTGVDMYDKSPFIFVFLYFFMFSFYLFHFLWINV